MTLRLKYLACTALTAAALIVPAMAEETVTMKRSELEAIMNRLDRLEKQVAKGAPAAGGNTAELEQRVQDLEISQGAKINALQQKADAVQLTFDNNRPVITTGDGRFELAFRGRFHFDAGTFSQNPGVDVPYAVDSQNVRDLGSGSYFRRAQFGVEGKFFRDFDYEMRFNFGGSEAEDAGSINIMRVAYNPTPEIRVNVGAIQPTFTLDDSTSSNDITFLERAAVVNALIGEFGGSDGRKGIEATYLKQGEKTDFMVNVAYTTSTIGARNANADDRDHLLGRIAARVFKNADWDVHLGANAATILSMGGVDITSPTALLFPIAPAIAAARARGIWTVIDGAHAPGQVALDLPALGADFYVGNCHKWLMAPKGCGFLWARADRRPVGLHDQCVLSSAIKSFIEQWNSTKGVLVVVVARWL